MELDSRKKSRRDRMMRLKSFEIQEVRKIGQKEARESSGFPILWMVIIENIFQMEERKTEKWDLRLSTKTEEESLEEELLGVVEKKEDKEAEPATERRRECTDLRLDLEKRAKRASRLPCLCLILGNDRQGMSESRNISLTGFIPSVSENFICQQKLYVFY